MPTTCTALVSFLHQYRLLPTWNGFLPSSTAQAHCLQPTWGTHTRGACRGGAWLSLQVGAAAELVQHVQCSFRHSVRCSSSSGWLTAHDAVLVWREGQQQPLAGQGVLQRRPSASDPPPVQSAASACSSACSTGCLLWTPATSWKSRSTGQLTLQIMPSWLGCCACGCDRHAGMAGLSRPGDDS